MKMRNLILPLLTLMAFNSNAAFQTVKVSDGTTAYCNKDYSQYSRANMHGAYRARAMKVDISEEGMVEVEVRMQFLRCAKKDGLLRFVNYSPLSSVETRVFGLNGKMNPVQIDVERAAIKVFKDGVYKLLQESELEDNAIQTVKIQVPLEETLTGMANKELELGSKVRGNFDIMINKNVSLENKVKGYMIKTNARLGAFRVHFDVEKSSKGFKATLR
jgi:hypothetical protein